MTMSVLAIVVMNRTLQTNDVLARVKKRGRARSTTTAPCRRACTIVPYYDRSTLVNVTTHTVLHNLLFGCVLVFLIQWLFLGDLRSAVIVAHEHSVRAAVQHHHAGADRAVGQSAVARRGGFWNHRRFGGDSGRKCIPQFPTAA